MSDTMEDTDHIITFDAVRKAELDERIAKLTKLADKLGVPPMTYDVLERGTRTDQMKGSKYTVDTITVLINGKTPQLPGGWKFVGAIEHSENGNLVHGNDPVLASFRSVASNCEHCGANRKRNKTVILRSDEGEVIQVGATCLKDFLGYHGSVAMLTRMVEEYGDVDTDFMSGQVMHMEDGIPTDVFMAITAACVRVHGWTAKSSMQPWPTVSIVRLALGIDRMSMDKEMRREEAKLIQFEVTPDDEAEAKAIRAWIETIPTNTTDNYLGNLKAATSGSYTLARHMGIAASAVSARHKAEEGERKKQEATKQRAESEWVGAVGDRLMVKVTVRFVRTMFSEFGDTFFVEMEDELGNILKTFSSGKFGSDASKGWSPMIKATVKKHDTYNGSKSTMLARVTVVENKETN